MSQKLLAFAVVLLAAAGAAAETNSVAVRDAWARATPGKAANGAVYLTLEAAVRDRLTGLATPVAKKAELHAMTMEGGVMKMRLLAGVDLPPGQAISLQPGAAHIMLVGLTERLRPGQSFPLTLYFETAGPREITVSVGKAGAMAPEKAAGAGMPTPAGQ